MQTYTNGNLHDNYVDMQYQYVDMQGWLFVNKRFMQKKFITLVRGRRGSVLSFLLTAKVISI